MVIKHSRAQRRHDRRRLKRKRKNLWGYGTSSWRGEEMPPDVSGMVVATPKNCSCPMCCNPRRSDWYKKEEKLTMQERKLECIGDLINEYYEENQMDEYREMAKLAALVATGVIAEDALLEAIGDESIVSEIMAIAGATAITGMASGAIEDTVDTVLDVVDDLNPFSGW